jgi:orotate phosphoribosyltransferase-like protein
MKLSEYVGKRYTDDDLKRFLEDETVQEIIKAGHDDTGNDFLEWNVYYDQKLLDKVVKKLCGKMEEVWDKIDCVASLGASGCPLATKLASEKRKPLIFIHDRWGITEIFHPIRPFNVNIAKKNVLLVDSIIRTGLTTFNAVRTIRTKEGIPILTVMCLLNEWIDRTLIDEIGDIEFYFIFPWNKRMFELAVERGLI